MRLRDWSEGRDPRGGAGVPALYYSAAEQRCRAGSERALGRLLLLLLQLPLLDPRRVVRQRRGRPAAPHPSPLGTRRAARRGPSCPVRWEHQLRLQQPRCRRARQLWRGEQWPLQQR